MNPSGWKLLLYIIFPYLVLGLLLFYAAGRVSATIFLIIGLVWIIYYHGALINTEDSNV